MSKFFDLGGKTLAFWDKEIKESDWRKQEIWEDYPTPNYKAKHTYCQVAFDDSD